MPWRKYRQVHKILGTSKETKSKRKAVTYKVELIDSIRFMASSPNTDDTFVEGPHKGKCKDYRSYLEHVIVNNGSNV